MTFKLDLSNDWQWFTSRQTVAYSVKVNEGQYLQAVNVPNTVWDHLNQYDYQRQPGLLQQTSRVVHLWSNQLQVATSGLSGTIIPKLDDVIKDQYTNNWIVSEVQGMDLDDVGIQRWRATCYLSLGNTPNVTVSGTFAGSGFYTGTLGGPP